jgi:hypothetical protein
MIIITATIMIMAMGTILITIMVMGTIITTIMISAGTGTARRTRRDLGALPLPASGERVGVRGTVDPLGVWKFPLTRSLRSRPLPASGERCLRRVPSHPRGTRR